MPRPDGWFASSPRTHFSSRSSRLRSLGSLGALGAAGLFALVAACSSSKNTGSSSSSGGDNQTTSPAALDLPSGYVRLPRSVHPLATPQLDVGASDLTRMAAGSISFKLTDAQKADRDSLLLAVQDARSPSYHHWLTPDDYAARFGASRATIAATSSFLASQGLMVGGASRPGTRVTFKGTRAQVERTFHAEMHDYFVGGKTHFALATAPAIPSELESVVLGVHGLHDFRKKSQLRHGSAPSLSLAAPGARTSLHPDYDVKGVTALGPDDFAVLYDTKPLLAAGTNGTGVTIAIVGQSAYSHDDVGKFLTTFSLTNRITDILVPGTGASTVNSDDDAEETDLDLEWSSATAPGANIAFVYVGGDTNEYSVDDALDYVIDQGTDLIPGTGNGGAQIVSESYGSCDLAEAADADLASENASVANLEGITYLGAAGDDGSAGCIQFDVGGLEVGPPASLPGVTGVGGTEFPVAAQMSPYFVGHVAMEYPASSSGVSLETAWNDLTTTKQSGGAGGGGHSTLSPKPFYQTALTPADGDRDVPDVSLTASPANVPYYTIENGEPVPVGGTSASTPSVAGILALVGQAVHAAGGPLGLGNVNPILYSLFTSHPEAFHDIVTGNNDAPCIPSSYPDCPANGTYGGFNAGTGYDLATGLGSLDAANLVAAWQALAPSTLTLSTSATSTSVTTPITLSAHVASSGSVALSGTVSFSFETLGGATGPVYAGDSGGSDESWALGTVTLDASNATTIGADVQVTTKVPPGLYGKATVVALYSGDSAHLPATSSVADVSVTGANLAITPATFTLRPNEQTTFTASGGEPPILWFVIAPDTTCVVDQTTEMASCSEIESETEVEGFFQAGPVDGTVRVVAIDTLGEEAVATITVAGTGIDAGTFPTFDAGPPGGPGYPYVPVPDAGVVDAGVSAKTDGGAVDAGASKSSGSSGGCAVSATPKDSGPGGGALLSAVGLGLALVRRRRR